ncbi:MAG TPA: DEAD/DEAH box helicase, partial [Kiloniellales bacterium]|nr:DEAD/DEAH box helicase [Kiloniellales bacterium]
MTFTDLGLSREVLKAVGDVGYTEPTPIQAQAIPYILMGRDVLGCAQTGTGKTASFTLPMIDILARGRARARMPRSLILTPTRELAAQIAESFDRYGKHNKLTKALLIGGSSVGDQERVLDRGVDVLIATPGRLIDLFERGKILLADVKILVIDEADRMLDMGFIPDVERIVGLLPKIRQTLFFSATLAPEIRRLADAFLMNPKEITVSPPTSAAQTVTQRLVKVAGDQKAKRDALRALLASPEVTSGLIFCNRKKDVDILYKSLNKHGLSVAALHGDMAQPVRTETLERFKSGAVRLLVCSDVAARGLDIPAVSHVFNFDVPVNSEDYIHRIGRTGRAGRSGIAYTLATAEESKALAGVQQMLGLTIPELALEGTTGWDEADAARETRSGRRGRGRGKESRGSEDKRSRSRKSAQAPRSAEKSKPAQEPEPLEPVAEATEGDRRSPAANESSGGRVRKPRGGVKGSGAKGGRSTKPFGEDTPAF